MVGRRQPVCRAEQFRHQAGGVLLLRRRATENFAEVNKWAFMEAPGIALRTAGTFVGINRFASAVGVTSGLGALGGWLNSVPRMLLASAGGQLYGGWRAVGIVGGTSLAGTLYVTVAFEAGVVIGSIGKAMYECAQ